MYVDISTNLIWTDKNEGQACNTVLNVTQQTTLVGNISFGVAC